MTEIYKKGNDPLGGSMAPLQNVTLFMQLVQRVMERPHHLPGLATFHGYSGYGKTFSANFAAHKYRAYYIEAGSSWTKKKFCQAILREMNVPPKKTVSDMMDQIVEALSASDQPLIIDEFDYIIEKNMVDLVREIHDQSAAPIILIGEEFLPKRLEKYERFHNRILDWVAAAPVSRQDVSHLARLYCPDVDVAEDLLDEIHAAADGRVRRAAVNLNRILEKARIGGRTSFSKSDWGTEKLYTGQPPRRSAV